MNKWQLVFGVVCLVVAVAAFASFQGYPLLGDLLREGSGAISTTSWSEAVYDYHLSAALCFLIISVVALAGATFTILSFIDRERRQHPQRPPRPTRPVRQPDLRLI